MPFTCCVDSLHVWEIFYRYTQNSAIVKCWHDADMTVHGSISGLFFAENCATCCGKKKKKNSQDSDDGHINMNS